jgi:pyrroline-5-carboxylate reductase
MRIGLVGAGNMAVALARGWGEPVLVHDAFAPRAEALVAELGGEVVASNAELARRADVILLCHKPAGLERVAAQVGGGAKRVISILGGVPLAALKAAYGGTPVVRMLPSVPVEVRQGVSCHARDRDADPDLQARALELFGRVGPVFTVDEAQIDVAMGLMSCAPAYIALIAEAQVDAGVRAGLPAPVASDLVVANLAGTAALLQAKGMDTLAVRRLVTSPGGSTARGVSALEHAGLRSAFDDAMQAVLSR